MTIKLKVNIGKSFKVIRSSKMSYHLWEIGVGCPHISKNRNLLGLFPHRFVNFFFSKKEGIGNNI